MYFFNIVQFLCGPLKESPVPQKTLPVAGYGPV